VEHALHVGAEAAAVHCVAELIGPVADPALQLANDLPAAHLDPVGGANHRGEGDLVQVMVLVEPARLVEQPPLLPPQQNGTLAPGPEKFTHPHFLACRQVGRQQVGTVYGRVLALLPRHQAGFFVREKLFVICI
jgi:hypothetical protein